MKAFVANVLRAVVILTTAAGIGSVYQLLTVFNFFTVCSMLINPYDDLNPLK